MTSVEISWGLKSWVCSAIYASPIPSNREFLWGYLQNLMDSISISWLVVGNFNEILASAEVKASEFYYRRAERFATIIDACGLIDIGAVGSHFT